MVTKNLVSHYPYAVVHMQSVCLKTMPLKTSTAAAASSVYKRDFVLAKNMSLLQLFQIRQQQKEKRLQCNKTFGVEIQQEKERDNENKK